MKKILLLLTILISSISFSQAPEGINYQAVIRNSTGNLVSSTTVAIRVQVRQTTATGTVVYQERHSVLTSAQGLVNMVIGGGTPQVGTFNGINWGMGPFFVNLAVDFANGINYQDFGTQQLMSVPYALYAKSSGNQLNQWRYGNTVPPSTLGNFGDFYLDVITGNVYYKNSGTAWILTGNIKGPVGPTGLQGPAGVAGAQGPQGIQGATGPQGVAGTTGPQGPIGLTGPAGATGSQGPQGVAGNNGQNTLVKTSTEAIGANCTTGGIKIEFGLDVNNNGTLDLSEINASLTKYVCNGAAGATGAQGIQGVAGPTGAQGPIGLTGPQGVAGTNGTNGQNTLVKTTTESAGANCTNGGIKIEYGLDANSNGVLDVIEISTSLTKYVCNGAVGATGAQGIQGIQGVAGINGTNGADGKNTLAKTTTEAAGANCTTGGVKIEYGLDANNNGILDLTEINASLTKYVCNGAVGATGLQGATGPQGPIGLTGPTGATGPQGVAGPQGINGINGTNGTNGQNTLVKTTTEAAGVNCTTGGIKIEYGLDVNNNGTLDLSEINTSLTKYVCNGATGATGAQGAQGIQGVAGANGTNGTNGTNGLNALIKTTTEPAGANCTNGGTKIETGLDANGNGVLDASEVNASQTQYVCNGFGISNNNFGTGVNAQHGYKVFTADTFFVVNQSKLIEVNLRGGNGGNGGSNICGSGGTKGQGSGAKFFISVDQGDTIYFKVGINGTNGCNSCVSGCSSMNGANGSNGTASIISINSPNHINYILKANGGTGGTGAYTYAVPASCACAVGSNGSNGVLQYGTDYNISGILNITEVTGLGALVSIRW